MIRITNNEIETFTGRLKFSNCLTRDAAPLMLGFEVSSWNMDHFTRSPKKEYLIGMCAGIQIRLVGIMLFLGKTIQPRVQTNDGKLVRVHDKMLLVTIFAVLFTLS